MIMESQEISQVESNPDGRAAQMNASFPEATKLFGPDWQEQEAQVLLKSKNDTTSQETHAAAHNGAGK
jgi:hypothetical protein